MSAESRAMLIDLCVLISKHLTCIALQPTLERLAELRRLSASLAASAGWDFLALLQRGDHLCVDSTLRIVQVVFCRRKYLTSILT